MFDPLFSFAERLVGYLGDLGYQGVFWLSFIDRVAISLVPAEVVLPAFGVLVEQGVFDFWKVLALVTIGSFLGNLGLYFIFRVGGRPFLEKYGKYFFVSKHDLDHLDRMSEKYGNWLILIGYAIPTVVRSLVPVPAGISRFPVGKFALLTLIGTFPLNYLYVYAGMKVGANWLEILNWFREFDYLILGALVAIVVGYVYNHKKRRHFTHD